MPISSWMVEMFGARAFSYTDAETRAVTITVCLPVKPPWGAAVRHQLAAGLERIRACGLPVGAGTFALRRLPRRDWAESWKRHFRPLEIGSALLLRPSWSRRRARTGQSVIVLDPGLSFGTGRHPTTAFCLRQLVAYRPLGPARSFLDIGTGSGILAIAAAKLGYRPIRAFDFDPDSVRTARQNAVRNRVQVAFSRYDVTRLSRRPKVQYSLVCANLISDLLVAQCEAITAQVRPAGVLAVAGILTEEFPQVRAAYEGAGLTLVTSRGDAEWCSGAFRRLER